MVITFNDITSRKRVAEALAKAEREANTATSRLLAAASHDLRQPLQTLSLLQGLLAKTVQGDKARNLVARQGDTLDAMAALLVMLLGNEGYQVVAAHDGPAALQLVQDGPAVSHLLLADFNLPGDLNGLQTMDCIRQATAQAVPALLLTSDISSERMREVAAAEGCTHLNRPALQGDLIRTVATMLACHPERPALVSRTAASAVADRGCPVFVVDDDASIRAAIRSVLEDDGRTVEDFADGEAFLASHRQDGTGCLLIDAYLPGMDGLKLLRHLQGAGSRLPAIMITGRSDVAMAVQAMKAGASDFIEKPLGRDDLLASIDRALDSARDKGQQVVWREEAARNVASLTPRGAADHEAGGRRPAQQEHRCRPRHQQADGGKSPGIYHAQDRRRLIRIGGFRSRRRNGRGCDQHPPDAGGDTP